MQYNPQDRHFRSQRICHIVTVSSTIFYIVIAVLALMIGLSKGGLGGLLGAMATPFLSLVVPPDQAVGLVLPLLMIADIFAVSAYWQKWDWYLIRLTLPAATLGVFLGAYFLSTTPTELLRDILGGITILFSLYKLGEKWLLGSRAYQAQAWHGLLAGSVAGFASAISNSGGPPMSMYLLLQKLPTRTFIATSAIFFTVLNWVKVPFFGYSGIFDWETFRTFIWVIPLLPVGVWIGRWMAGKINQTAFETILVALLFVTGVLLILR